MRQMGCVLLNGPAKNTLANDCTKGGGWREVVVVRVRVRGAGWQEGVAVEARVRGGSPHAPPRTPPPRSAFATLGLAAALK